jgi:hypothetical protein
MAVYDAMAPAFDRRRALPDGVPETIRAAILDAIGDAAAPAQPPSPPPTGPPPTGAPPTGARNAGLMPVVDEIIANLPHHKMILGTGTRARHI